LKVENNLRKLFVQSRDRAIIHLKIVSNVVQYPSQSVPGQPLHGTLTNSQTTEEDQSSREDNDDIQKDEEGNDNDDEETGDNITLIS
jgi:hypothetical protein